MSNFFDKSLSLQFFSILFVGFPVFLYRFVKLFINESFYAIRFECKEIVPVSNSMLYFGPHKFSRVVTAVIRRQLYYFTTWFIYELI